MNEQQLLRAIGAADPEHLEKSEQKTPKRRRRPWAGWAVAACLCLVVGAVFTLFWAAQRAGPETSVRLRRVPPATEPEPRRAPSCAIRGLFFR